MRYEDLDLTTIRGTKVILKTPESGTGLGGAWIDGVGDVNASSISIIVSGDKLLKSGKFPSLNIDANASYEGFTFSLDGKVATVLLSAESTQKLRAFGQAQHKARVAKYAAEREAREAAQEAAVPGLKALREARAEWAAYRAAFEAAMEDEYNDGARMPRAPQSDTQALAAQYPRAALYLKAEDYAAAANYAKATAGEKAMQCLMDGGSEADAEAILDSWLKGAEVD